LEQTQGDDLGDLFGGAALGLHREHGRRAEVDGDPRVHGQLAGSCDVGVVAADDQYRVALVGYVVIPVDDVGDRAVRILMQLLVADADTLVVGQTGGRVGQQQFQDVVAVLAPAIARVVPLPFGRAVPPGLLPLRTAGDGAEDTDLGDGGRQPVQDAQCDRRLAGIALRRGDVDRV